MGKQVTPGNEIGIEEEFIGGRGTYVEEGKLNSSLVGETEEKDRTIGVERGNQLVPIAKGTVVYGRVEMVIEPIVILSIEPVEQEGVRFVQFPNRGVIRAPAVSNSFVKYVHDEFKIGDIVKAKVEKIDENDVNLTTAEDSLGVVKAFCTKCRGEMSKKGTTLTCNSCGSKERRKFSSDYGVFL